MSDQPQKSQSPCLRTFSDEIHFSTKLSQFARLSNVVEIITGHGLIALPVILTLFKRQIPNKAAHTSIMTEQSFLFFSRGESESEAAKNHINLRSRQMVWLQEMRLRAALAGAVSSAWRF